MTTGITVDTQQWREQLVRQGFSDDGVRLRGGVSWNHPLHGECDARVEIEPDDRFPFAPPHVRVLDAGCPLDVTFHLDRATAPGLPGDLCLWDDDWPVDQAPWRDLDRLLQRVAGWLELTAAGWPDDDVCDLERYLEPDPGALVLYDAAELADLAEVAVRTQSGPTASAVAVTNTQRTPREPRGRRGLGRKDRRLAWIDDLGAITQPVRAWADLEAALGDRAVSVARHIKMGAVDLLLLRYQRGRRTSLLAIKVRPTREGIDLKACEGADTSRVTRLLRAGPLAPTLATVRVAVVGCGAIGSFVADLLFRSGVRHLMLRDHELLRPGNIVRHLCGHDHLGQPKVTAVRDRLATIDPDVDQVAAQFAPLRTLAQAVALVGDHDVVIDATGSARASSLLATAAALVGAGTGHTVVSVCVQREGDVLRVDRLPARPGETHLPALLATGDDTRPRERGCGSPVSRTPPGAVIAAAELACRVAIDEATSTCSLPATLVDVRRAQPESPYDRTGMFTPRIAASPDPP